MLVNAAIRYSFVSPTRRARLPVSARHSRTARSITVWQTASRSKVVRAIVWITSRTAASRSSARSRSRRTAAVSSCASPMSVTRAIVANRSLLLVALDDLGVADMGRFGVLSGLSQRAPLPEQVPALVEADLELLQPVVLVRVQPTLADAVVELVLLGDELLDLLVDLCVVHLVRMPQANSVAVCPVVMGYTLSADEGGHQWHSRSATRHRTSRRTRPTGGSASTTGSATRGRCCSRTRRTSRPCARPSSATWHGSSPSSIGGT